jgi:hypothetical protein
MVKKSQEEEMNKSVAVGNVENNAENHCSIKNFLKIDIFSFRKVIFKVCTKKFEILRTTTVQILKNREQKL